MSRHHQVVLFLVCILLSAFLSGCQGSNGGGNSSAALGITGDTFRNRSSIKILPAAASLQTNAAIPLVVTMTNEFGLPAPESTKVILTTRLGGKIASSSYSDLTLLKGGFLQTTFTSGTVPGVETIYATGLGLNASVTLTVSASPQTWPLVRVTPSSDQIKPGESIPIIVFVNFSDSGLPANLRVFLYSQQGGSFAAADGTADNGVYLTTYTASTSAGIDTITAVAGGIIATASIAVFP